METKIKINNEEVEVNKEAIQKVLFTLYPHLAVVGYKICSISKVNKIKSKCRNKLNVLLMNTKKCTTFIIDSRNYRPIMQDNNPIPYTPEIKKLLISLYNHFYYTKYTINKRKIAREKNKKEKKITTCKKCGKEFKQKANGRFQICRSCRNKAKIKPLYTKICKHCGETFTTLDSRQIYCSKPCRFNYNNRKSYHKKQGEVNYV